MTNQAVTDKPAAAAASPIVRSRVAGWAFAAAGSAALADAAIETFRSQSPARWWVIAATVAFVAAAAAGWRFGRHLPAARDPWRIGAAAWYVLLGLLAGTVWLPEGLERGVRFAGQPTPALLALASAAAVLLAGWLLFGVLRSARLTSRLRLATALLLTLLIAYPVAAFLLAAAAGTPYAQLFDGGSFWRVTPFWLQGTFLGALVIAPLALVARTIQFGIRRWSGAPGERASLHQITALAMSVVMALAAVWVPPGPKAAATTVQMASISTEAPMTGAAGAVSLPVPARSYDESMAMLDRVMEGIAQLRAQIDRTQFDVAALQERPGDRPADLIAFVRNDVAFEQYPGLLRGAQGTLMSRAGNALDQAVLLATLLQGAGHQARIARGTLTEAQAEALCLEMAAPRPAAPPVGDLDAIRNILVGLGRVTGVDEQELARLVKEVLEPQPVESTDMYRAARADAEFILASLAREGIALGTPDASAALIREAREYFWVEHRRGASEAWTESHPAFSDPGRAPRNIAAAERFASDAVPKALQHLFRVRVVNEQLAEGQLSTYEAMGAWERPTAVLNGVTLTYFNYPGGLKGADDLIDLPALFEKTGVFIPTFNDRPPEQGSGFDWDGETYRLKILAAGQLEAERTGKALAKKMKGFAGILDALGSKDPPPANAQAATLSAQWIEYGLVAPGGKEKVHRRTILDRIDPAARAAGRYDLDARGRLEIGTALTRQHTFMLAPGRYPEAYAVDRVLERIVNGQGSIRSLLRKIHFADEEMRASAGARHESGWLGHFALYAAFDSGVPDNTKNYRSEPSLIVYRQPFGFPRSFRVSLDIVNNSRRALRVANGRLAAAPADLVRTGAWETHSERLVADNPMAASATVKRFDTMEAFRHASAASIPNRILRPPDRGALADLDVPQSTKAAIDRDLAGGYVVIVPAALAPGSEHAGWWRVDPATGETLGMIDDGRGSVYVEYLAASIIFSSIALNACLIATAGSNPCNCLFVAAGVGLFVFAYGAVSALEVAVGTTLMRTLARENCR